MSKYNKENDERCKFGKMRLTFGRIFNCVVECVILSRRLGFIASIDLFLFVW